MSISTGLGDWIKFELLLLVGDLDLLSEALFAGDLVPIFFGTHWAPPRGKYPCELSGPGLFSDSKPVGIRIPAFRHR